MLLKSNGITKMKITSIHMHQWKAKTAATTVTTTAYTAVITHTMTHGRPACPQSSETTNITASIINHYHQHASMSL